MSCGARGDRPMAVPLRKLRWMELRPLGRTGVQVSPLCLGTMMFGAWGKTDHDESIRIIHRALDAGINFVDTADVYSRGESEEIVGKALAGGRRDDVVLATKVHGSMGDDPNQRGNSRRWIIDAVENSLRRLGTDWIDLYQIHRPEPDTDIDETLGALTDLVRQGKVRYIGSSTFPPRRSSRRSGPPSAAAASASSASSRRTRCCARDRGRRPARLRALRDGRHPVEPARRRLALRPLPPRRRGHREPPRPVLPQRFDMSRPENRRKIEAVYELTDLADEAGLTMIQLALGFVSEHPAVTAADHRPAHDGAPREPARRRRRELSADVLDRIDEIVPPGTNLNPADAGWRPPALEDAGLRRRSTRR